MLSQGLPGHRLVIFSFVNKCFIILCLPQSCKYFGKHESDSQGLVTPGKYKPLELQKLTKISWLLFLMTLHAGAHVYSEYYFNFFHFLPFSLAVGNIHSVPELQFLLLHP